MLEIRMQERNRKTENFKRCKRPNLNYRKKRTKQRRKKE